MKVVINSCYGGFSLSPKGERRYLELKGKTLPDSPKNIFYSRDLKRSDPILVQVVEELGAESFGKCAKLKIVDIDKGRWFKIDEYDGYESVQYRDIDDEWILAE